jgi:hypothetical protein
VDSLDLHVEQRIRIEIDAEPRADEARQRHLVRAADCGEALAERGVTGERREIRQRFRVVQHARPDRFDDERGQFGVRLEQPAAERDAVGLVDDPLRMQRVQIAEYRLPHELGVQRRDAVDPVRAEEGEMSILTRRSGPSSISDTDAGGRRDRVPDARSASRCCALMRSMICRCRGSMRSSCATGHVSSASAAVCDSCS